jgi:hypothetical protein
MFYVHLERCHLPLRKGHYVAFGDLLVRQEFIQNLVEELVLIVEFNLIELRLHTVDAFVNFFFKNFLIFCTLLLEFFIENETLVFVF